jgi:hypothetical protein
MRKTLAAMIALAGTLALAAGNFKLYLKDGTDQLVRDYKIEDSRLLYYSVERSDWEEIPLDLVDLVRTDRERKRIEGERQQRLEEDKVERKAEREFKTELHKVPLEDGVYWANGESPLALKQGEPKMKGDKKRSVLKVISPIPMISGKATVELEGEKAAFIVNESRPTFYIRLDKTERFGIIKLTPKKDARIVENITIVPVTKETIEEQKEVEVFRQQLAPNVYRIWPVEPIEPGEYAVVQFTQDKVNIQVWDFAYRKQ